MGRTACILCLAPAATLLHAGRLKAGEWTARPEEVMGGRLEAGTQQGIHEQTRQVRWTSCVWSARALNPCAH